MRSCRLLFPAAVLLTSVIIGTCRALLLSPLHHVHHPHRQIIKTPKLPALFSTTAPSSTVVKQDDKISTTKNHDTTNSDTSNNEQLVKELGISFTQKLFELEEYQRKTGHCLVPKRYECNPSLGNWVNKQRQNYRKFVKGEKTSMNEVCCDMS